MSSFEQAVAYVLRNEGGYVFDPDDLGGATNYGITQNTLAHWRNRPVSPNDVKNLTLDEAKAIYHSFFWRPLSLDLVVPLAVSTAILDTGVLHGLFVAGALCQRALNSLGRSIIIDGHIGQKTSDALNACDVKDFLAAYINNILARIDSVVASRPLDRKFEAGWIERTKRLQTLG